MTRTHFAFLDALATALAQELGDFASQERALAELRAFESVLRENPAAWKFFSAEDGAEALKKSLSVPVRNALRVLAREEADADKLTLMIDRFHAARKRLGLARAVSIRSAAPLASGDRERLQAVLERRWGMKVSLEERVESALIGGFVLRSGDWQFDASIRGRLKRLAAKLSVQ